ncbi:hypothetical protein Dsin_028788 [Dipteronia sinensis]|uniref:Uncharacterized protein n=1 Tax=Dipteronia sinensis TaxID=43782 RepID=A0AAD9ZRG1_9ROSI|nr:hypothetical protein Dsin_028788 [Dipteronia sinensis]
MNSNYNKPRGSTPGSLNNINFDFDLGMGSSRPKSLNDQKNRPTSSFSSYSTMATPQTQPRPAWQPNTPSWTHQPAPIQSTRVGGLEAPVSMVGDIHGKSWTATAPSKSNPGVGIVGKNPNLFGDLVSSALGQGGNKSNSNMPLKNAAPTSNKGSYSMGNLADSLPKTSNSTTSGGNWGSGGYNSSSGTKNVNANANVNVNVNKSSNLGGPSMKNMSGNGMQANKDPFGSLFDLGSKQSGNPNLASKGSKASSGDDSFGDFQNAPKPSTTNVLFEQLYL